MKYIEWIEKLKFNHEGLIPVIIQDEKDDKVLMLGYMEKEALRLTLKTGLVHFYSRSRKKLWKKGETSGHTQKVKEILLDCDEDTLLIKVEQKVASCHKGYRSCFYRRINPKGKLNIVEDKVFSLNKTHQNHLFLK